MHVFFEDDGAFKAGTVLADHDTSLQIEAASGKRMKIKAANVLLRFAEPSPATLLADAQTLAAELDPDFLWQVSDGREFAFTDLASEYYGRLPKPAEAVALALCLHASPMHFYKKGKGRYRAAPDDALKAALAGLERKRREGAQVETYVAELKQHRLPAACGAVPSTHEYHFNRFLFEVFPNGTEFPPFEDAPELPELPATDVRAF